MFFTCELWSDQISAAQLLLLRLLYSLRADGFCLFVNFATCLIAGDLGERAKEWSIRTVAIRANSEPNRVGEICPTSIALLHRGNVLASFLAVTFPPYKRGIQFSSLSLKNNSTIYRSSIPWIFSLLSSGNCAFIQSNCASITLLLIGNT